MATAHEHIDDGIRFLDDEARDLLTLHKRHLPTGRVSLEAIVRFLILDLDVAPRRADWRAALDRHEEQFRQTRTWT